MNAEINYWRKCSTCKKEIGFSQKYYVCSVSTCNGQRTGYVFCSLPCWEAHVPTAKHRDAAAEVMTSPAQNAEKRRIIVSAKVGQEKPVHTSSQVPRDILIVASKLKDYIRIKSDMNTSAGVLEALSDKVRALCDEAIERAQRDGRKTVMDRDF